MLSARHAGDLFVPECKDGPTQTANHLRLDAWAMARSWTNPAFDGYEIKVSRSDWTRDSKVQAYLPLCNRLWIVCPSGLIQKEEIPESMGLLWASKEGARLLTKKKAPYRQIEPPVNLLRYVLMCRVSIQREREAYESREARAGRFAAFVQGRIDMQSIGSEVSRKLRAETLEKIRQADGRADAAELRARRAEATERNLENAASVLTALGVEWRHGQYDVDERIREAVNGLSLSAKIGSLRHSLDELERRISRQNPAMDAA